MKPLNISISTATKYYYDRDVMFGSHGNAVWHGRGAAYFGLNGKIENDHFINMLHGKSPKRGLKLIESGAGKIHRAAIDIPFSAPKSVSIMALLGEDKKIIEAHNKAVSETIDYIERRYIHTRKTKNGQTRMRKGGRATFACFTHSTSRTSDPHLLLMNMVKTEKGWKALCNDPIWKDQTFLTSVYSSFLKERVEKLGYKTRRTSHSFELEGISRDQIELFSQRRIEVSDKKKELEKRTDLKPNQIDRKGFLTTRKKKDHSITPEQLRELWNNLLSKNELLESIENAKNENKFNINELNEDKKLSLIKSVLHENESVLQKTKVLSTIMKVLNVNINDAEKFFSDQIKSKQIVHLHTDKTKRLPKKLYSTKEMIKTEKHITEQFFLWKNMISSPYNKDEILKKIDSDFSWLTKGQKKAVEHIVTGNDRFSVIQGDAGTGKTACIKAVKQILDEQQEKSQIEGMGFTGKAAQELETQSGVKSSTIDSFLSSKTIIKDHIEPIWIVDESSMVSSFKMEKIIDKALKNNAKVFFIGDGKQLASIGAGKMFSQLQKQKNINTIKMDEVLRQKTKTMQNTVKLIKDHIELEDDTDGKFLTAALDNLKKRDVIVETKSIAEKTAISYVDDYGKKDTLMVCPDNKLKDDINEKTRQLLKKENKISNKDYAFLCHELKSLNNYEKHFSNNYEIGTSAFISGHAEQKKLGKTVRLESIDNEKNILTYKDEKGSKIEINPMHQMSGKTSISIFKKSQKKFSKGEKIVFLKNDKKIGVQNGLTGIVKSLDEKGNISVNIGSKTIRFNQNQYAWLDHGYAVTVHKSQGQTCDKVLFATSCEKSFMNNSQSFYVAATRAKYDMKIFTDDLSQSAKYFERKMEKTSTLEYSRGM